MFLNARVFFMCMADGKADKCAVKAVFNPLVSYKFPRLVDKYDSVMRGGSTVELAKKNVDFAFGMRSSFNCIDKLVSVASVANFFEATIHYLSFKHVKALSEHEQLRWKGSKSKILLIDGNNKSFDDKYSILCKRDYYAVSSCRSRSKIIDSVGVELPDLVVISDESSNINGYVALRAIRGSGFNTPVIIYGRASDFDSVKKFSAVNNFFYFLNMPFDHQLLEYVELALNGVKPKSIDDVFIP